MEEFEKRVMAGDNLQLTPKDLYSFLENSMKRVEKDGIERLHRSSTELHQLIKASVQGVEAAVTSKLGSTITSVKEQLGESMHYLAITTDGKLGGCDGKTKVECLLVGGCFVSWECNCFGVSFCEQCWLIVV